MYDFKLLVPAMLVCGAILMLALIALISVPSVLVWNYLNWNFYLKLLCVAGLNVFAFIPLAACFLTVAVNLFLRSMQRKPAVKTAEPARDEKSK